MTEDGNTEMTPPMTAMDAEIADLKKMIADMKSNYESLISDYQSENRRLYARAVGETEPEPDPAFSVDRCAEYFYKSIGIQQSNGN